MSLLELKGVRFSHTGKADVLRNLSLEVDAGSITAILGPNGAGKTTLLDICLGWRKPDSGSVLLDGRPLSSWSRRERGRLMSLVPQTENLRFDFSVLDYVLLGRTPHLHPLEGPGEADRKIARESLALAGVAGLADRSITTLSGGECELMLIARSLAQQPRLLLLDEPAGHLDPSNQLRVVELMRKLARRGITIVYTSHNPQTAAVAADRIALLSKGRLRHSGSPRAVLTSRNLRAVYGVPFHVTWIRGRAFIRTGARGA